MMYLELFLTFFMIGAFTFGGGYAMLPMIQQQVAARWSELIPSSVLVDFVAVSESTPGPFAVNMATYVGTTVGGPFGAVCATLGVVLPSFIVILIVAHIYDKFRKSKLVRSVMSGLKPAVVGLIASAVLGVVITVFFPAGFTPAVFQGTAFYVSLGIFLVMLLLAFKKTHPIAVIGISALLGVAFGYLGLL